MFSQPISYFFSGTWPGKHQQGLRERDNEPKVLKLENVPSFLALGYSANKMEIWTIYRNI